MLSVSFFLDNSKIAKIIFDACHKGLAEKKNVVIIDSMVVAQKLTPKPEWVEPCSDLAQYFHEKVDNAMEKSHSNINWKI